MIITPPQGVLDLSHLIRGGHTYAYNIDIGLRKWKAALAKLKAGQQSIYDVSVCGDSISEGANSGALGANGTDSTKWQANGFAGRIRSTLNTKFGDVGTGFIPIYYPYGSKLWTFSGSGWQNLSGVNPGVGAFGVTGTCAVTPTNGDSASLAFVGTGINIMFIAGSVLGTAAISIDGGAATNVNLNQGSVNPNYIYPITGLATGNHTITITAILSGGQSLYLVGAQPIKGTSGVRVNIMSRYGTTVANHTSSYALKAGIDSFSPILTIIPLVANDFNTQVSLANYQTGLQTMVSEALPYGDVLLVADGVINASLAIPQSAYVNTMKQVALTNNVAFLDLFNRWGGSYTLAQGTLGLYASGEGIHPNDFGHQDMATAILNVLLETAS